MRGLCTVEGCSRPRYAKGFCKPHYRRMRKYGTTSLPTAEDRFWAKVDKTSDCWLWTGSVNNKGYGTFGGGRHDQDRGYAHRRSYELLVGLIPDGMGLDHRTTCPKRCVNPEHLRLATQKQNMENLAQWNSSTGFRNVYYDRRRDKWYVQVKHNQQKHHGGSFDTLDAATEAAQALRIKLFTHNDLDRG